MTQKNRFKVKTRQFAYDRTCIYIQGPHGEEAACLGYAQAVWRIKFKLRQADKMAKLLNEREGLND